MATRGGDGFELVSAENQIQNQDCNSRVHTVLSILGEGIADTHLLFDPMCTFVVLSLIVVIEIDREVVSLKCLALLMSWVYH